MELLLLYTCSLIIPFTPCPGTEPCCTCRELAPCGKRRLLIKTCPFILCIRESEQYGAHMLYFLSFLRIRMGYLLPSLRRTYRNIMCRWTLMHENTAFDSIPIWAVRLTLYPLRGAPSARVGRNAWTRNAQEIGALAANKREQASARIPMDSARPPHAKLAMSCRSPLRDDISSVIDSPLYPVKPFCDRVWVCVRGGRPTKHN